MNWKFDFSPDTSAIKDVSYPSQLLNKLSAFLEAEAECNVAYLHIMGNALRDCCRWFR